MAKKYILSKKDIDQNTVMYDKYHTVFKMEDGWHSGNKANNYTLMLQLVEFTGIPISGAACLDVGCGSGDLSYELRRRGAKSYKGLDIYKPSLSKAQMKYPTEQFIEADFLSYSFKRTFDYVFCSGALTVNLPTIDYHELLSTAITKMWQLTNIGMVFNVLTDDDPYRMSELNFYSPTAITAICKSVTQDATVICEKTHGVDQIHVYIFRDTIQR